jgi:hypothetical protein
MVYTNIFPYNFSLSVMFYAAIKISFTAVPMKDALLLLLLLLLLLYTLQDVFKIIFLFLKKRVTVIFELAERYFHFLLMFFELGTTYY